MYIDQNSNQQQITIVFIMLKSLKKKITSPTPKNKTSVNKNQEQSITSKNNPQNKILEEFDTTY